MSIWCDLCQGKGDLSKLNSSQNKELFIWTAAAGFPDCILLNIWPQLTEPLWSMGQSNDTHTQLFCVCVCIVSMHVYTYVYFYVCVFSLSCVPFPLPSLFLCLLDSLPPSLTSFLSLSPIFHPNPCRSEFGLIIYPGR